MIRIHFTYSQNIISKLARLISMSKFSHVEIEINGICYSAKPFKGVYKQTLRQLKTQDITIESFHLKQTPTAAQLYDLINFLDAQVGKKYDYKAVIACGLFRRNWADDTNKWFCSELVARSLELAGLDLTNKYYMPNKLIPESLILSLALVRA